MMLSLRKSGNGTGCKQDLSLPWNVCVGLRTLEANILKSSREFGWKTSVCFSCLFLTHTCPRLYWAVFSMSRNYRFFRGNSGHNIKSSGDKICGQRRLLLTDGKLFQRALHRCKSFSLNKAALSKKFYTTTNNSTCMTFLPLEASYRQNIHVLYCPQIFEEKSAWPKNGVAWLKQARRRLGQEHVKQAVD